MRYLLFGTGDCYERYKRWFKKEEIVALLDNAPEKQNRRLDDVEVLAPDEGIKRGYDAIIILSFYVEAMRNQLINLGVSRDNIYHFYDLHKLIDLSETKKGLQCYGNFVKKKGKKSILLLNQNLAIGGPAYTLFDAAKILKNNGYDVVFGSMLDGPLREVLLKAGIPVIIDENLLIGTMEDAEWVKNYELIICNAINFYVFLSRRSCSIPIIWWLHDSEFFYEGVDRNVIKEISSENLRIFSVGPIPKKAIRKYLNDIDVKELLYGVNDKSTEINKRAKLNKIVFVTVGFVEARKGQDILVNSIKKIPMHIRQKAQFYIVGKDTSLLAERVKSEAQNVPEIIITGMVDNIYTYLSMADVLICPSREDPMPAVAAEAMMLEIPCIFSDIVGTASYVKERENGIIFENQNVDDLSKKIIWCIENKTKIEEFGKSARSVYEKYFSMNVFEKNLLNIIENYESINDNAAGR